MKKELNHEEMFMQYNLYLPSRTIYMGDYYECIEEMLTSDVIKSVHILETMEPAKDINIIINSLGGYEYDAFAIYDTLISSPCSIQIRTTGACMSAATIILQAGDYRMVTSSTSLMIHDGTDGYEGNSKDYERWAEWSKKFIRPKMYEVYYKRMKDKNKKITMKEVEAMCEHDYIFSPKEAVKLGLADVVV